MKTKAIIITILLITCLYKTYSQEITVTHTITPPSKLLVDSIDFKASPYEMNKALPQYNQVTQTQLLVNRFCRFTPHYARTYTQDYNPLGGYEHFNNNLSLQTGNLIINAGFGLLKQSTALNSGTPNLHYTLDSYLEYQLNPWLAFYVYGQYLSSPINQDQLTPDPISYMNPFFYNTEMGGGIKAKYKNIKADVGMQSIKDTQFKDEKSLNTMNTKVSIGF